VFDLFKKGMEKHGKEFLVWASTGRKKFLAVPDGTVQRIVCSACGQEMETEIEFETNATWYTYCKGCSTYA